MSAPNVYWLLAGYTVVFVMELLRHTGRFRAGRTAALVCGIFGLAAHTAYLLARSRQIDLPPLLSSTHDWLLVLAWLAVVLYLFLTLIDRTLSVGLFLLPLVLLLIFSAFYVSDLPNSHVSVKDAFYRWALLHASLLVFGIAGVIGGFVLSMMYLAQHHRLKHKLAARKGLALPSLAKIARLNWWAVVISVPTLTLGMATGFGLAMNRQNGTDAVILADPVIIVSSVAWFVMVLFFFWRLRHRTLGGKQVAWMTIWAFGFLLVTLIGLQVFTADDASSVHQRQTSHRDNAPLICLSDVGAPR
jgi:ABC-type uncharacterized transport system permease subunit